MLKSEAVIWWVLFIIEAFVIVFNPQAVDSSYLLINLASADIVVGACPGPMFGYLIGGQLWVFQL